VKSTPGFEEIKKLPSFVYLETGVRPGSKVDHTVDLFTGIGSVILMHEDPEILKRDVERVRQMERENALFEYETSTTLFTSPANVEDRRTKPVTVQNSGRADLY
jgi:hypothetical protein